MSYNGAAPRGAGRADAHGVGVESAPSIEAKSRIFEGLVEG